MTYTMMGMNLEKTRGVKEGRHIRFMIPLNAKRPALETEGGRRPPGSRGRFAGDRLL